MNTQPHYIVHTWMAVQINETNIIVVKKPLRNTMNVMPLMNNETHIVSS